MTTINREAEAKAVTAKMKAVYKRPIKTQAAAVGHRKRAFWSKSLRSLAMKVFPAIEVILAEEVEALSKRKETYNERAAWTTMRIRFDQAAVLGILQERHLKATGKEIARAEVMAALMTAGLRAVADHEDFNPTDQSPVIPTEATKYN
jgi:hypothetical protein